MMGRNEETEISYAFDALFQQIKVLKESESTLKYHNYRALENCKQEIENLFLAVKTAEGKAS